MIRRRVGWRFALAAIIPIALVQPGCIGDDRNPKLSRDVSCTQYTAPASPIIRPNSLSAYEVHPGGEFRRVPLDEADAAASPQNWDWGKEGVHYPANSGAPVEIEKILNPGYVLTGIGARVGNGSVSRLRLRQVGINDNWEWDAAGSTWTDWVRNSADDGQSHAEQEISVPKPFVITGLGMRISGGNVAHIRVQKREYSPIQRKLIGPGYFEVVGAGQAELYWDTSLIVHTLARYDKMVIVGVGLREHSDNLTTLKVYAAYLDE